MIHLFNKIYIKGDHQYKVERDSIVISPSYGAQGVLAGKFTQLVNKPVIGTVYYQGKTYQQIIDDQCNGDDQVFFRFLLDRDPTKRLTIYANVETALYLLTRFYKTVFPGLTANTYAKLMRLVFARTYNVFGAGFLAFTKIAPNHTAEYRAASEKILGNEAQLKANWAAAKPWKIRMEDLYAVQKGLGVEFQLATYLTNPVWSQRISFERKTVMMVKKGLLHDYILDAKSILVSSFMNLKALEPTANFDPMVNTMEDFVAQFPMYRFVLDDKFLPDNYEYVWRTYNLNDLVTARRNMYALVETDTVKVHAGIGDALFKKNLSLKDILDYELSTPATKVLWAKDDYDEVVNSYTIDLILDALRNNNLVSIKDLAVAGD